MWAVQLLPDGRKKNDPAFVLHYCIGCRSIRRVHRLRCRAAACMPPDTTGFCFRNVQTKRRGKDLASLNKRNAEANFKVPWCHSLDALQNHQCFRLGS